MRPVVCVDSLKSKMSLCTALIVKKAYVKIVTANIQTRTIVEIRCNIIVASVLVNTQIF